MVTVENEPPDFVAIFQSTSNPHRWQMIAEETLSPWDNGYPATFEFDWDHDGTLETLVSEAMILGVSFEHPYEPPAGWNLIQVRVTDDDGGSAVIPTWFKVAPWLDNQPPTADAGGPYDFAEGEGLQLDASGSSDPDNDALLYRWDIDGDGRFGDATGAAPLIPWDSEYFRNLSGPGEFYVSVEVDDGNGHVVVSPQALVTVNNSPPYLVLMSHIDPPSWSLSAADFSSNDELRGLTYEFDWDGDGTPETITGNPYAIFNHPLVPAGPTYTFLMRVSDPDGGVLEQTITVDVLYPPENQPPTADAGGPYEILVGQSLTLDGSASSDPDNDPLTYSWDVNGDGNFGDAAGVSPTLSWSQLNALGIVDPGTYTVRLVVVDGRGGDGVDFATLTVNGVPEMDVFGRWSLGDIEIPDGSTPFSVFLFGALEFSDLQTKTYKIKNNGAAVLDLSGGVELVQPSAAFQILAQPATSLAPGEETTFDVAFIASSPGIYNAGITIANNDADENPYNFTLKGTFLAGSPEIAVEGAGVNIPDGTNTTSLATGTDFGFSNVGFGISRTYTVYNNGSGPLDLSAGVTLSGAGADAFGVLTQPAASVPVGESTTFTIFFLPASPQTFIATVNLANNDLDENPFDFAVSGTAEPPAAPEMDLYGTSSSPYAPLADNDATPSLTDGTSFGTVTPGTSVVRNYVVKNSGAGPLHLTGPVQITGPQAGNFSVIAQPAVTVASGGYTVFSIRFVGQATGTYNATISLANDDANESLYDFAMQAAVAGGTPEIEVRGSSTTIASGDTTPSAADGTLFAERKVGAATTGNFVLVNRGDGVLDLSGGITLGPNSGAFEISHYPRTQLAPGTVAVLSIRFAPQTPGFHSATVRINSNDADEGAYTFVIAGATPGNVNSAPTASAGGPYAITVGDALTLSAAASSDPDGDPLTYSWDVNGDGAYGDATGVNPTLSAAQLSALGIAAPSVYSVRVQVDDGQGNVVVSNPTTLTTSVLAGDPEINVQYSSLTIADGNSSPTTGLGTDFGAINYGATVSRTFTVQNTGAGALSLGAVQVTGAGAGAFTVVQPSAATLASGEQANLEIRFGTNVPGTYDAVVSIPSNDSNENPYDFAIRGQGLPADAEIAVGKRIFSFWYYIPDGAAAGSLFFRTDSFVPGTTDSYSIRNLGASALDLSAGVSFTGAQASSFSVTQQPVASLAPGGTTSFQIQFNGTDPGVYDAEVVIPNNDSNENPFNFGVRGRVEPEINIHGLSVSISDGATTPSTADGTDFGSMVAGAAFDQTFTVQNTGYAPLDLTAGVTLSGTGVAMFSVVSQPAVSVPAGGSTTFTVRFAPAVIGTFDATVSLGNNDRDENPYNFSIRATATQPPNGLSASAASTNGALARAADQLFSEPAQEWRPQWRLRGTFGR